MLLQLQPTLFQLKKKHFPVQARVVVLEALELVVGRFQRFVGHEDDGHALAQLDLGDFGALFVEQEATQIGRASCRERV